MTEITEKTAKLPDAVERFVLHWGDMGGQWGVNRSVSQIHALLYLSERPLTAEEIAAKLGLARSNVSTSIRELMAWNLIRRVPVKGDRREHFEAETDLWEIAMRIAAVRKERELDPAVAALEACVADAERDPKLHPVARKRLERHAGLRRHAGPLVRADAHGAEAEARRAHPSRHPGRRPAAARKAEIAREERDDARVSRCFRSPSEPDVEPRPEPAA